MQNKNYIKIRGDNNIILQDITGNAININNFELIKTVINNANKEFLSNILTEIDNKANDLKICNETALINLLNLIKTQTKKRNIQIKDSDYVNLGNFENINGDIIFGKKITNNYYENNFTTNIKHTHNDFLQKLKHSYESRLKAKMNNELGFKLDLKLRYTKKGTDEQFIKSYYIDNYSENKTENFNNLINNFNNNLKRLLILGKPGSGKSVLILQFALSLIKIAENNENFPIPIIIDLATWNNDENIEKWLEQNLKYVIGKYHISKTYARNIIINNNIIPLLDGFDEIKINVRNSFFTALNKYLYKVNNNRLPENKFPELIITSRVKEYKAVKANAPVHSSIEIQDLSSDYIEEELKRLKNNQKGNAADILLKANLKNPDIIKNIKTGFSAHIALKVVKTFNFSNQDLDNDIVDYYINAQLKESKYTEKKSSKYLSFISSMLTKNNKGNRFELIDLQVNWLKNSIIFRIMYGVIFGLSVSYIGSNFLINHYQFIFGEIGLTIATIICLSLGIYVGFKGDNKIRTNEILQFRDNITFKHIFRLFVKISLWLSLVFILGLLLAIEINLVVGVFSPFFSETNLSITIWISVWVLFFVIVLISQKIVRITLKYLFKEKNSPI